MTMLPFCFLYWENGLWALTICQIDWPQKANCHFNILLWITTNPMKMSDHLCTFQRQLRQLAFLRLFIINRNICSAIWGKELNICQKRTVCQFSPNEFVNVQCYSLYNNKYNIACFFFLIFYDLEIYEVSKNYRKTSWESGKKMYVPKKHIFGHWEHKKIINCLALPTTNTFVKCSDPFHVLIS